MDRREKLEFILYQMKIMIKKKDYVRLFIISKKINEKNINDDEIADIKITYYSYLAIYYNHMNTYAECTRCYRIIYETLKSTKKIIPDELDFGFSSNLSHVLSNYIGFLALQTWSPANEEELKKLQADETIERDATYSFLIGNLLLQEVVTCDITAYRLDNFELFRDSYENSTVFFS
jgi:26S proteasome regulatory subunit N5